MFNVTEHGSMKQYTVYYIDTKGKKIKFLIYKNNQWQFVDCDQFLPVKRLG